MFTGLIEEVGTVQSILKGTKSAKIVIHAKKVLEQVQLGDSIAVNGVCLTVTDFTSYSFAVDVMAETMRRTNLANLTSSSKVNLERALRLGDRLGGHWVSGHIDGIGIIRDFKQEDNAVWVSISAPPEILKYIIEKGSIAIDGISLTVAYVDESIFKVSIIPHTKDVTTLLTKSSGDAVNLEGDMIGKYIERFLSFRESAAPKPGIDMEFLKENGFL
ncbi:riboflavin synthase [Geosporobacter ferrireducens]|uniref:Riboflavin synthase n=1 Tax=Geosporobacter ferrireducens TaxID=1424294 RepID=A0A1D8GL68_9FIRM|nr:riboflavin synthase [Geosporobacter ferrireducens]AOT71654.1 riboflavin synthase subunit alpha [Geosporobacter ferrireducens]MTI55421.1 riboflavin synthase [Geosporobacter ferrireducens]